MSDGVGEQTVVGGFAIRDLVGKGAVGSVYRAVHGVTGELVALKVLSPELGDDERFRSRFLQEARLAAALHHRNVVRVLASGEDGGTLFLAMELIEGENLRERLRRERRLAPDPAFRLLGQVADGLDAAHAVGLVHRDIKPGNILVSADENADLAYVCDFGLARHVSSAGSLTGERGFVGSIDYIAPEQVEGRPVDRRADIYALACVLFECLSGYRPFERESDLGVLFAHLNEPPPRITAYDNGWSPTLDDVFAIALAKSPTARYSTCRELIDSAQRAIDGHSVSRRRRKFHRPLLAGIATVLLVVTTALAGVYALRDRHAPSSNAGAAISESAIGTATLGLRAAQYKQRFGAWRSQTDSVSHYTTLAFPRAGVTVYFAPGAKTASIMTTWNSRFRTAEGIGPCSTLGQMERAYGSRAQPTWAGTTRSGVHSSYAVGKNLLFSAQDHQTVTAVALYAGNGETRAGSPQALANFLAANETACVNR